MRWSAYSLVTGVFADLAITGDQAAAALNLPPGHALHQGAVDHLRHRMDLETGELVDYQPPAPANTAQHTWAWDWQQWRWRAQPTTAALAAVVRSERDARLAACDWVVIRAQERQQPVDDTWAAYRQALRNITAQPGFPAEVAWPTPPA